MLKKYLTQDAWNYIIFEYINAIFKMLHDLRRISYSVATIGLLFFFMEYCIPESRETIHEAALWMFKVLAGLIFIISSVLFLNTSCTDLTRKEKKRLVGCGLRIIRLSLIFISVIFFIALTFIPLVYLGIVVSVFIGILISPVISVSAKFAVRERSELI